MDPVQPSRRSRRHRRRGALLMLGVGAFGLAAAAAASLGGLSTATLGAANRAVTSCDTNGVRLAYTNTYDSTAHLYVTSAVTVSTLNRACRNKSLNLTLASATTVLGTGTIPVLANATTQTVTMSTLANAKLVTRVAVVITG